MAGIASKNLFDLLGDDANDADSVAKPSKENKPAAKTGKPASAAPAAKPAVSQREQKPARGGSERGGRGRGRGDRGGFRGDRPPRTFGDDAGGDESRESRGGGRSRGRPREGRGNRENRAGTDDRHSKSGVADHDKQVAHGWGGTTGGAEWADEQAGEAIAKADEVEDGQEKVDDAANGEADGEPTEPEQKVKSLDDYLAEQAEKKLQLGGELKTRKANEGAAKKWNEGKEFTRAEQEEHFIAGTAGKKVRERAKKEKAVVELDGEAMRPKDEPAERRGGFRGRGRGGDGGFRGRGDGERGRGRGRGGDRGRGSDRGTSDRGRGGGRGGRAPNVSDTSAFPTLGS